MDENTQEEVMDEIEIHKGLRFNKLGRKLMTIATQI
jgi:hypothetical protein